MVTPLKTCVLLALLCSLSTAKAASPSADNDSAPDRRQSRYWRNTGTHRVAASSGTYGRAGEYERGMSDRMRRDVAGETVSRFGYEFELRTSEHFRLMYRDRSVPSDAVARTCDLLEQVYQRFYADFGAAGFNLDRATSPLTWVVFDQERQYRDFARLADSMDNRSLESYYSARSNQVVLVQVGGRSGGLDRRGDNNNTGNLNRIGVSGMDRQPLSRASVGQGGGMLDVRRATHEAAHQLAFNSGLQKRGVMYPLWIAEGLATNLESDCADGVGVARDNPARALQLRRANSNGRLMPLDSFVNMVEIPSGGAEVANDMYAQAWGMFNFLFKTRRVELKRYLDRLARVGTGPRDSGTMYAEFTSAFGPVSALEKPWADFIDTLQVMPRR